VTLPLAFSVAAKVARDPALSLEREVRYEAARWFRQKKLIPAMIDRIKELLDVTDDHRDT
jgi:CRISPR-associated protein Cas1